MEDCCYRCGRIGHHRQECTEKVSKDHEYMVSRLCKRIHKDEQGIFPMFKVNKKMDLRTFPVRTHLININYYGAPQKLHFCFIQITSLENALRISTEYYFEEYYQVEALGRPTIDTGETEILKSKHHEINMRILQFRKTDEELMFYCKKVKYEV